MKTNIFLLLFMPVLGMGVFGQDIPKKSNTIIVEGVSFSKCMTTLLDIGYTIQKSDSIYKTITTDFKNIPNKKGKETLEDVSITLRIKDSTAYITGRFINRLTLTAAFGSNGTPGPNDIGKAEWAWAGPKLAFLKCNEFAELLKGRISYSIQ